jgi:hypothetical protein
MNPPPGGIPVGEVGDDHGGDPTGQNENYGIMLEYKEEQL